jgi:hypothetical protein
MINVSAQNVQEEYNFMPELEPKLRRDFMAAASSAHRSAPQVVRELMLEFIARQNAVVEYEKFLQQKVDVARAQMHTGKSCSNETIEQKFAKRRKEILRAVIEVTEQ